MRWFIATLAFCVALGGGIPSSAENATPARPSKGFDFEAKVCQGDPLGTVEDGEVKVLGSSSGSSVPNSKHGAFRLHYNVKEVEDEQVILGYLMRVKFESAGNGKIRLRLTLEHTGLQEDSQQETIVRTSYKRYDRVVKDGETVRLRFGKSADRDTWLELRVREDK
jgi:hypothetical protein